MPWECSPAAQRTAPFVRYGLAWLGNGEFVENNGGIVDGADLVFSSTGAKSPVRAVGRSDVMWRTLRLAIVAILAASLLVACTAPMKIRLGVTIQDDSSVHVSFLVCGNDRAILISITEKSSFITWDLVNHDTGLRDPRPHWFTFTALKLPSGWDVDEATLTELSEDETYHASVASYREGTVPFVEFTLAGLRALGENGRICRSSRS